MYPFCNNLMFMNNESISIFNDFLINMHAINSANTNNYNYVHVQRDSLKDNYSMYNINYSMYNIAWSSA